MDTAEERAAMAMVVDPHRAAALSAAVVLNHTILFGEGRLDRRADEGHDGEVVILLGVLHPHGLRLGTPTVVRKMVEANGLEANGLSVNGLKAKPLAEGVGGVEGLGTHGLAEVASIAVGVLGLDDRGSLAVYKGLRHNRVGKFGGGKEVAYGSRREGSVGICGSITMSHGRDFGHNDPDRTRGCGCRCNFQYESRKIEPRCMSDRRCAQEDTIRDETTVCLEREGWDLPRPAPRTTSAESAPKRM